MPIDYNYFSPHSVTPNFLWPEKSAVDALHIATSVTNGIDFLLTWNGKHIANAFMRSKIEQICRTNGYEP